MSTMSWFPGHMAKARRAVAARLKQIDVVLEVLDARAPYSSRNPEIDAILADKPRVIVLNKADLADPAATRLWADHLRSLGWTAGPVDARNGQGISALVRAARDLVDQRRGAGRQPGPSESGVLRAGKRRTSVMLVGIPNVGKSSVLNRLGDHGRDLRGRSRIPEQTHGGPKFGRVAEPHYRRLARTGALPGVTRGEQWIHVGKDVRLLDVPGILWPRLDDPDVAQRLAFIGAITDRVLSLEDLAPTLLRQLWPRLGRSLGERYGVVDLPEHDAAVLPAIAEAKGWLLGSGLPDSLRAATAVLTDFREGKLGQITLEPPEAYGHLFSGPQGPQG